MSTVQEHFNHIREASRIWNNDPKLQAWSQQNFPKNIQPDNEDKPINLISGFVHLRANLYKNGVGDVFEFTDKGLTLVIDPNKKYK